MFKLFISIVVMTYSFINIAKADVSISGFMQHIVGMGDEVDGGVTDKFTRVAFGADTTADNGWTVGGSFALSIQVLNSGASDAYLPTSNSMYVQTDMGTVTIGQTADAATNLIPRVSAMVPGDGTDGYYFALFDSGTLATSDTGFAEVYYAQASSRINYALPVINGFSVQVTYTPALEFNSSTSNARQQTTEASNHGEATHVAISYEGEMDGISYTAGVASINGNAKSTAGATNNDLAVVTGGIKATMGNITVGVGYAHQEKVDGGSSSNVKEDTITYFGLGYDIGGGVNTWVQFDNISHSDGNHATTEADPQLLMAGISLGF